MALAKTDADKPINSLLALIFLENDTPLNLKPNALISLYWSPDQISGYLQKENIASISHERIYQFLIADKKASVSLCSL